MARSSYRARRRSRRGSSSAAPGPTARPRRSTTCRRSPPASPSSAPTAPTCPTACSRPRLNARASPSSPCPGPTSSSRRTPRAPPPWCASTSPDRRSRLDGAARPVVVELADGVAAHLVGEHEAPRSLVAREPRAHPVAELVGVGWVVAGRGDDGADDLAPLVVGDTEHHRVDHAGMLLQHLLDLLGPDLLTPRVDAVRAAAEQGERAVGVEHGLIP